MATVGVQDRRNTDRTVVSLQPNVRGDAPIPAVPELAADAQSAEVDSVWIIREGDATQDGDRIS